MPRCYALLPMATFDISTLGTFCRQLRQSTYDPGPAKRQSNLAPCCPKFQTQGAQTHTQAPSGPHTSQLSAPPRPQPPCPPSAPCPPHAKGPPCRQQSDPKPGSDHAAM